MEYIYWIITYFVAHFPHVNWWLFPDFTWHSLLQYTALQLSTWNKVSGQGIDLLAGQGKARSCTIVMDLIIEVRL